MLKSLKELLHYTVSAIDGEVGKVVDFLFDDKRWTVRCVRVEVLNDPEKRKERGRQLIRKARGQLNSPTRPKPVTCEWPGCSRAAFVEDHDHSTGQWRFYLCGPHNSGLGLIGDTKAALQAGIELFDLYCNDPQFNKDI